MEEKRYNQLTFHWCNTTKEAVDASKSDMWLWWNGKVGSGFPVEKDTFGLVCTVKVPEEIRKVGFIFRTNCSTPCEPSWGVAIKDFPYDRYATITGKNTVVYLKAGDSNQYQSTDNGKTLSPITLFTFAGMEDKDKVRFLIEPAKKITDLSQIKIKDSTGKTFEIESCSSLGCLATSGTVKIKGQFDIKEANTIELEGYGEKIIVPMGVFDSQWFIDNYTYDGNDLGATIIKDKTIFKLWAPTAQKVLLKLFHNGNEDEAFKCVEMQSAPKGIWTCTLSEEDGVKHGTYYTYEVTTAVNSSKGLASAEAVDPYAKAAGVNGNRAMVVDLETTNPKNFTKDEFQAIIDTYSNAIIWEIHVRDFSSGNPKSKYPGKYLAFTETGLKNSSGYPIGVDYLKELGITHVQLQPVFDYATVDEDLEYKDCQNKGAEHQFNWGYDPKNYNVPEGSYSTDPYHGEVRITELKSAIQSLHENHLGVVMDVVYNHTYNSDSFLNRIVPYYYYRYAPNGSNSNGSGCGNETASNRKMFRKLMIDSLKYWMTEYHFDGFRFDLMAIHDVQTLQEIEKALHKINPKCLIYGEGWAGGACSYDYHLLANQNNVVNITATKGASGSIAIFNDVIRDGLKGEVFNSLSKGYINGNANRENANKVAFGIKGGYGTAGISWSVKHGMVVNYMSAHDNNTLWDKLRLSNPRASEVDLMRMNKLGIAIIMISKGMPFMLAGEEILKSKKGDSNSYKSSDSINNIDWESLKPGSKEAEMLTWYKDLIKMRNNVPNLWNTDISCTILGNQAIEVTYKTHGETVGFAVVNPTAHSFFSSLPSGSWRQIFDGENYKQEATSIRERVCAPAYSVILQLKN